MKQFTLLLFCFLNLVNTAILTAATRTWEGTDGGGDGTTWTDPLNWNSGASLGIPTAADRVYFQNKIATIIGNGTITVGQIIVRNTPDDGSQTTDIKFDITGTLKASTSSASGTFFVISGAQLTLDKGTFELTGDPGITAASGGQIIVNEGATLQLVYPTNAATRTSGILTREASSTHGKSKLTNGGIIEVGAGFLNGGNIKGDLVNLATGKLTVVATTVAGRKGDGLLINGGTVNNTGVIIIKEGYKRGFYLKSSAVLTNNACGIVSTTDGHGTAGFVVSGSTVTNNGIIIKDTNGPICATGFTYSDAEFIINGTSGATLTYNINGGTTQNLTFDGSDQTITVANPTAASVLNLENSTNCPTLATAIAEVALFPLNTVPTLTISTPEVTGVCGGTVDLTCLATSPIIGGDYTYWPTAKDAAANKNRLSATEISQISESGKIHVKYTLSGGCSVTKSIKVNMTNTPILKVIDPPSVCAGNTVNVVGSAIGEPSGGTLTYHTTAPDALSGINTISGTAITAVNSSQKIYARYELGPCSTIDSIQVKIYDAPSLVINNPPTVSMGTMVDVTAAGIAKGRQMGGELSYYATANDAMLNQNPLNGSAITAITTNQIIYVRYELDAGCFTTDVISVTIDNTLPFKLYMEANGDDMNSGLSEAQAVQTLARVQEILVAQAPTTDIEVHIGAGTYADQEIIWTYTNGRRLTFTAKNFSTNRPIFEGNGGEIFFSLRIRNGTFTNTHFRHLQIQNYKLGIIAHGNRDLPETGWNGNNYFYGLHIENIGSKHTIDPTVGFAGIDLFNSRSNTISNCRFVNNENLTPDESAFHCIYMAHYSINNLVRNNIFEACSGDPIRTRDSSNYNIIENNTFKTTGRAAFYSDWYCSTTTTSSECTKASGQECPSFGNVFRYNKGDANYFTTTPKIFHLFGVNNYCGEQPTDRVIAYGNTLHGQYNCTQNEMDIDLEVLADHPSLADTVIFHPKETITSDGVIKADEHIQYKAGMCITFRPGFTIQKGATFSAKIENCVESIPLMTPPTTKLVQLEAEIQTTPTNKASLAQNLPNPFIRTTQIPYFIPTNSKSARIQIYSIYGQLIETLNITVFGNGQVEYPLNGFGTGIYQYTLMVDGEFIEGRKMVLVR